MIVACLAVCSVSPLRAAEPSADPLLRVNPNDHTGKTRVVATDAAGRWLVTASQDKTARVWDARDGRLLMTLRIPIGTGGLEGELDAVAVSPDGRIVAVGGFTQFNDGSNQLARDGMSVYLFDRASGRMLGRVSDIPGNIVDLAFSPDGRIVAAALARHGLVLFSVADSKMVAADPNYRAPNYSVHFSKDGRLVTASWDGMVREYRFDGAGLTLIASARAPGGRQPAVVRFSPDGSRVAVCFMDSMAVNVLDARDLSFSYAPDTSDMAMSRYGGLISLGWSSDGAYLYAGGNAQAVFDGKEQKYIRRWSAGGKGAFRNLPAGPATVPYLLGLPDGRIAFTSAVSSLGVLNANGTRAVFHGPATPFFRDSQDILALSTDGARVRFAYEEGGKSPAVFDIASRTFTNPNTPGLTPARTSMEGMNITGWRNVSEDPPQLNGVPLKVGKDMVSSLAILPDGSGFVLGTMFRVRAYDRSGSQRWERPAYSGVEALNVSQDGRWIVVANGDGILRWLRVTDGEEELAFYAHPDRKRWVMWTPSGYYDASAGGDELIGWHINRGKDRAAEFYPISQFRERFYRPDVIAQVIGTTDEAQAVKLANAAAARKEPTVSVARILPPTVELVSAPERFADPSVVVRVRTWAPDDAPVLRLRVLVNGEIMATPRSAESVASDGARELTLALPPKDSTVSIYAENVNAVSEPRTFSLQWAGSSKVFAIGEQGSRKARKPKLWLLAVGVSEYQDTSVQPLNFASADASGFAELMKSQGGKAYSAVEEKVIVDGQATRTNVLAGLDWLKSNVEAGDMGIVFLAGHGFTMATDHVYYFGSVDVNLQRLTDTGVPYKAILDALTAPNLKGDGTRTVFFIDTCHAGDATGARVNAAVKASNGDYLTGELTRNENQVLVFASSRGDQLSWEATNFQHGAFTEALLEGLGTRWEADPRSTGRVTYKNLDAWISGRVPDITQGRQTPRLMAPPGGVDDFVLATK
jgi:WD40 repeat protein